MKKEPQARIREAEEKVKTALQALASAHLAENGKNAAPGPAIKDVIASEVDYILHRMKWICDRMANDDGSPGSNIS